MVPRKGVLQNDKKSFLANIKFKECLKRENLVEIKKDLKDKKLNISN